MSSNICTRWPVDPDDLSAVRWPTSGTVNWMMGNASISTLIFLQLFWKGIWPVSRSWYIFTVIFSCLNKRPTWYYSTRGFLQAKVLRTYLGKTANALYASLLKNGSFGWHKVYDLFIDHHNIGLTISGFFRQKYLPRTHIFLFCILLIVHRNSLMEMLSWVIYFPETRSFEIFSTPFQTSRPKNGFRVDSCKHLRLLGAILTASPYLEIHQAQVYIHAPG